MTRLVGLPQILVLCVIIAEFQRDRLVLVLDRQIDRAVVCALQRRLRNEIEATRQRLIRAPSIVRTPNGHVIVDDDPPRRRIVCAAILRYRRTAAAPICDHTRMITRRDPHRISIVGNIQNGARHFAGRFLIEGFFRVEFGTCRHCDCGE